MSDLVRVHNPNPYPVVYDSVGHSVDGHTSVMASLDDPWTAQMVEQGQLIVPKEPTKPRIPIPTKPKTSTKKEDATNE